MPVRDQLAVDAMRLHVAMAIDDGVARLLALLRPLALLVATAQTIAFAVGTTAFGFSNKDCIACARERRHRSEAGRKDCGNQDYQGIRLHGATL
jgi:hypothetical protein